MYKINLHAVMLGLEEPVEEKFLSKSKCEFCKWATKYLVSEYKTIPDIERLLEVHDNIHSWAKQVIELKTHDVEKAKLEFEKINKSGKTLFSLLDRIESEIKLYNV